MVFPGYLPSPYWSPYWICTQHPTWSYLILRAIPAIHEINALREIFWQRMGKFLLKSIITLSWTYIWIWSILSVLFSDFKFQVCKKEFCRRNHINYLFCYVTLGRKYNNSSTELPETVIYAFYFLRKNMRIKYQNHDHIDHMIWNKIFCSTSRMDIIIHVIN